MTAVQSETLRNSIHRALTGSTDLAALLGGVRIYDATPQTATFPFITLGQSTLRDWSTGSEDRAHQSLTVHVWSPFGGKKHVQEAIKAVRTALNDRPLPAGRQLVTLHHEFSEARIDPDDDTFHGIIRYRATALPARAVAA